MGQLCGKASKRDGEDIHTQDVQRVDVEEPPVQVVGSWQVPSKAKPSPLGRPPLSPPRDPPPPKKVKKSKSKKDKEKKGFRQTLDAWSSFGSFNGSINERQGREKRVGILGFEVANLVMKMMNLRMALFEDELSRFKEEVILSEASRKLISEDERTLWTIAALDRRRELAGLMMDVARLGKQSADAELQKLDRKFASLGIEGEVRPKLSPSEVEANIEWLQEQVASTADLYHELLALDTVNASLRRAQAEEEQFPGTQKESVAVLKQEAKEQERLVRSLKKKGLWSKQLDHILEVLVELVHALHEQLIDAFYPEVMEETLRPHPTQAGHENELGVQGLSLHYANVISAIDRMVSRPNSVSPASRDALYQMLPQGIKASLRDEISKPLEDDSVAGIRRNLDAILDVVTPVAGNTVRWCSDRRLQGHSDLCLMQTLHHADQARAESLLLDLVVNLHHLMSRAKNPLNPSGKSPNRTPSRSPIMTPPRAFPPGVPDADVAEALEEIPMHLRATVEPSVVDRADVILAKLDAFRTGHFRGDRAAGGASGRFVEVGDSETGGMDGMGGMGVRDGARGQSGAEADGIGVQDAARWEEPTAGAKASGATEPAGAFDNREEAVSHGPSAENEVTPIEKASGSPPGVSLWAAMADEVAERQEEDGSRTPDGRAAAEKGPSAAVAVDEFESPPEWGLGLLRKSMSVKRDGAKADVNGLGGVLGEGPGLHGETHRGSHPDGLPKLHRAGSGGVPKLGEEDVEILPRGWHPADRILEGEDGEAVFGLRSRLGSNHGGSSRHHAGLRGEESFSISEEEEPSADGVNQHNGLAGPDNLRLDGDQGGLMGDGNTYARDHYIGLREEGSFASSSKFAESGGVESPGLRSEVSLGDGIGIAEKFHSDSYIDLKVRSCRMSSDLYQPTGLGPNGTSNGQTDNGLTQHDGGLRHGFGSDLQIGEADESHRVGNGSADSPPLSTQRDASVAGGTGRKTGNGKPSDQAQSSDGQVPVQSYPGDFAKLTHRSSDPGAIPSRHHPPSGSARSNSYSGPQDPTGARKSRFSVQGSSQGNDARSYSENNLHGLGQPPTRKSGELRHAHDARKLSGELRKHSGELKSPGSSKRLSHEALGSPRTPRRSSPNSRSLHRRTGSKSRSPGSSMSSPRSMEPLSPAGVIDIDQIDI